MMKMIRELTTGSGGSSAPGDRRIVSASREERKRRAEENERKDHGAFLDAVFKGNVSGRVPEPFPAVLLAKQPALDQRLVAALLDSFGPLEEVQLVRNDDRKAFTIDMDDPTHPRYKPFFYNRGGEYGRNHSYWEALCHSMPVDSEDPADHLLVSASARYADRRKRKAIGMRMIPGTHEINAFVDALRTVNAEFLDHLRGALLKKEEFLNVDDRAGVIDRFIEGIWRNCAVQFHFGAESLSAKHTLHLDHVNSCLHMAVTLNGQRTVGFAVEEWWPDELMELKMEKGDVYLTSPAAIYHGVGVDEASEDARSVALQLRTYLSVADADALTADGSFSLYEVILAELDCFQGRIRMPSFDEWRHHLNERMKLFPKQEDAEAKPGKVQFQNVFETADS